MNRQLRFIATLCLAAAAIAGCEKKTQPAATSPPRPATAPSTQPQLPAGVKLYKEDVSDTPAKLEVTQKFIVPANIEPEDLRVLLLKLHDEVTARKGFKHHPRPTHVKILAYTSEEYASRDRGEQIAVLNRIKNTSPEIEYTPRE